MCVAPIPAFGLGRGSKQSVQRRIARRWLTCLVLLWGCAKIPQHSYGISRLKFQGTEHLDQGALRACLVTEQRKRVTLGFTSTREPACGEPPFDHRRWAGGLYSWPWTKWPTYDEAVFKLDLDRIDRWYQARGYYGARVAGVSYYPNSAAQSEEARDCGKHGCPLQISVSIEEGQPVTV